MRWRGFKSLTGRSVRSEGVVRTPLGPAALTWRVSLGGLKGWCSKAAMGAGGLIMAA